MKGFIGLIGIINLLSGLYNLVTGAYIYNKATTIIQQNMAVDTSILAAVNILIFVCSMGIILLAEKE